MENQTKLFLSCIISVHIPERDASEIERDLDRARDYVRRTILAKQSTHDVEVHQASSSKEFNGAYKSMTKDMNTQTENLTETLEKMENTIKELTDMVQCLEDQLTDKQKERIKKLNLVPIGDGYAYVPARILKNIKSYPYKTAIRKLLTAVFPQRVLATHSLTGKKSPAFPNRPAKKKLDPLLVKDVIQTITDLYFVPESVVRTIIIMKCADESKLYRSHRNKMNKKKAQNIKIKKHVSSSSEPEAEDIAEDCKSVE